MKIVDANPEVQMTTKSPFCKLYDLVKCIYLYYIIIHCPCMFSLFIYVWLIQASSTKVPTFVFYLLKINVSVLLLRCGCFTICMNVQQFINEKLHVNTLYLSLYE